MNTTNVQTDGLRYYATIAGTLYRIDPLDGTCRPSTGPVGKVATLKPGDIPARVLALLETVMNRKEGTP